MLAGSLPLELHFRPSYVDALHKLEQSNFKYMWTVHQTGLISRMYSISVTTENADYVPVSSAQLISFSGGSGMGTDECIDVGIINDGNNEQSESFFLSLTAGANSQLGTPGTATVTIIDDDGKCLAQLTQKVSGYT